MHANTAHLLGGELLLSLFKPTDQPCSQLLQFVSCHCLSNYSMSLTELSFALQDVS